MLRVEWIEEEGPLMERARALYLRAFPENERAPLERLRTDREEGGDLLALLDGETFCGFAHLLTHRDLTHILYFAVEEPLRDRGYGGQALALLRDVRPGNRILADIERPGCGGKNEPQRKKRKEFYLRNGFAETEVQYDWRGEAYEILSSGGSVTTGEFQGFWKYFHKRRQRAGA